MKNRQPRALRYTSLAAALIAAALALTLTRCGKTPSSVPPSGTFGNVYVTVLQTCTQCHVPGGTGANGVALDFTTQQTAYASLMPNKPVTGGASKNICSAVKLVVAGDAVNSYMAAVLFADYYKANNFGGQSGCAPYNVHLSDQHLTADEETSIVNWIKAGALNN